ncbi:NAD(P)-binding protein [Eremomyces bilateralis CBS 781.70]|uniref:NAD(P)-binding protein n=1 Tax=Eremomyces bilateralis CBS 781.70 TaxID=1392243 RepID=A0A6G1FS82_9PEZI|nr:NAD(P)-binding protein [Eremomyces bilateralis CBS 781.70]KAF1808580.1 NAD(P)-binding protein [Eremomyces bilateralis CBS 781.70]
MSAPLENIAIIGGGGKIGRIILRGLISAPQLSIIAFKRPGSTSTFPSAPNLKVVETDYTPDALASHLEGQDAVISVIGGTGLTDQRGIIDAAVTAGVRRFFPSEFSINGQSEVARQLLPFFAVKQETLDYLVEKEKDGLCWTSLIIGPLLDWCLANGFLGFDLTSNRATIWDDGNTRFSCVNEAALGKAVVASLEHPAETANKHVYISSLNVTQNQILQALEHSTATTWAVKHTTSTEQIDAAREMLAKGDFAGGFTLVKASCWSNVPGLRQHFEVAEKERLMNDVLGVESESLQETVERVLAGERSGEYYV